MWKAIAISLLRCGVVYGVFGVFGILYFLFRWSRAAARNAQPQDPEPGTL